jgi:hypothetical protein
MSKLLIGFVFLIALLFFDHFTADLPVLREMRGIIFYGGWLRSFSAWNEIAYPVGGISATSRTTAMLFSAVDAHVCGFDARCINVSQALLLSAAAGILFLHLTQLLANRWVAALLALLWCLSLPALEGALWQATQLDKLAMLFSLLYLIVLFHFIRRSKATVIAYICSNLLLIILLFVAFKSKESSFFLVPATALVVLAEGVKGMLARSLFAILPVGYGIFYLQHYLCHIPPDMQMHISAGDPVVDVSVLVLAMLGDASLLGLGNWGDGYRHLAAAAIAAMTLLIMLAAISLMIARWTTAARPDRTAKNAIYLAGVLAGNVFIVARTMYPHAYYLMIAEGALLGLVGIAVLAPIRSVAPTIDAARRFSLLGLLVLAILFGYAAQRTPGSATARMQRMSRIVNNGFAIIRSAVPAEAITDVQFLFPIPIDGDWYFFGRIENDGGPDPEMMSFVYGRRVPVYVTYHYGREGAGTLNPAGRMRVIWDADGSVRGIELGSAQIYTADRAGSSRPD